ncbi:hypothetical protein Tco_1157509 [Tanacetum coccineum]
MLSTTYVSSIAYKLKEPQGIHLGYASSISPSKEKRQIGRTSSLRDLILRFKEGDDEPIKSAWIRFQDLIKQAPHHGIQKWLLIDDTPPWGNNKRKEKREDDPEWIVRSKFEDELANFMLEKKSHTKGIGEMLDQHRKELHEQFSQILSTIRKSELPEPEAPTFAITTRSGVSTQDPPFPALPQSTSANHTEGATKKEGLEGAKPSIIQEPPLGHPSFTNPPSHPICPFRPY